MPTHVASSFSPSHPLLLLSPLPPECLARHHAVSKHPALNEKGLLKFIRGWRLLRSSWSACHIPAVPAQDRADRAERTTFYLGLFMDPFSRPWYPWISHSAKKDHQSDRARYIWKGNRVHNNSIPEGHPSLPAAGSPTLRHNGDTAFLCASHASRLTSLTNPICPALRCHCSHVLYTFTSCKAAI